MPPAGFSTLEKRSGRSDRTLWKNGQNNQHVVGREGHNDRALWKIKKNNQHFVDYTKNTATVCYGKLSETTNILSVLPKNLARAGAAAEPFRSERVWWGLALSDPDKLCNWLVCYKVCERRNEGAPTPELRSGRLDRAMRSKKERKKHKNTKKSIPQNRRKLPQKTRFSY